VPAIIYQLEDYKDLIDFLAIGTNDFTQYLLAADRNSTRVGHIYSGLHPAVIRALYEIFKRGTVIEKELSICGEMAGAPKGALLLMALGFRHLSVAPSSAPVIRHLIQSLCQKDLDRIRTEILDLESESDVRLYLSDELSSIDPILQEIDS
jgi:phosphotransferase system enzyme I (PtsP)